jgi:hypothetical protein
MSRCSNRNCPFRQEPIRVELIRQSDASVIILRSNQCSRYRRGWDGLAPPPFQVCLRRFYTYNQPLPSRFPHSIKPCLNPSGDILVRQLNPLFSYFFRFLFDFLSGDIRRYTIIIIIITWSIKFRLIVCIIFILK